MTKLRLTSPVGRLLSGSVDEPQTKDMSGNLRVVKSGPNAGQPSPQYYQGVAFAKADPATNEYILSLYRKAAEDFPALFPNAAAGDFTCLRPDFAFKVIDGDSPALNQKGKAWNSHEGYPGHYVVRYSSGFPPRCFHAGRYAPHEQIQEKNVIRRGYYVRVSHTVEGNGDQAKPGLYLNTDMVELSGYGVEIVSGPDATEAFGAAPVALPPGATAAPVTPPVGGAAAPVTPPVGAPAAPLAAPVATAPVAPGVPVAGPVTSPVAPVQPYAGYMAAPTPGVTAPIAVAPSPPVAPVSAPPVTPSPTSGPVMTAAANGATYEQMIAAGWTDETLRQHGMVA